MAVSLELGVQVWPVGAHDYGVGWHVYADGELVLSSCLLAGHPVGAVALAGLACRDYLEGRDEVRSLSLALWIAQPWPVESWRRPVDPAAN